MRDDGEEGGGAGGKGSSVGRFKTGDIVGTNIYCIVEREPIQALEDPFGVHLTT